MLANCTDKESAMYLRLYFQSVWPNDLKHACRMILQSQHIVLQNFRIRHDRILSIRRISYFGKCRIPNPSDSDSESSICLVGIKLYY